jgi:hypothetical protein
MATPAVMKALFCNLSFAGAQVEPKYLTMTNSHIIVASDDVVYVWHFRTSYRCAFDVHTPCV